jgi:hypothetical protein
MTGTTRGRPPHRAREGHGQHLQIRSLVSDPDDRHVDHLGRVQRFGVSSRPVTIGRLKALMVFKSIRDSLCATAATWAVSVSAYYVTQDHPVHIPQGQLRR